MALEHVATDQEPRRNEDAEPDVKDAAALEDEAASTEIRYRISSYGADYPVDGLVKRLRQGDIDVPTFQREFVWPLPQASRFIESLLLGLPVPSIFLSKDSETQRLMVIDGQQRLKSLRFFYDGLLHGKEFRLRGVTKEFENLTYRTLEDEDRRRLDDSILHAIVIRQEDPGNPVRRWYAAAACVPGRRIGGLRARRVACVRGRRGSRTPVLRTGGSLRCRRGGRRAG